MSEKRTPEIRFKGYTDPWEQRKLLDCIQKITDFRGRTPKKLGMDWSETGYLALSALNVKDGYIDFSQDVHYGDQALYDKWMTGNELHKGQVIFTTEAPMGNVAQIPDNRRYILSQRTIAFDAKLDLITENFLATVLRTPIVFASLTALSSGGTAKGVSQKSLATVDITLPVSLEEQEWVASMFAGIDNLITLHQRKYDKLVKVKKAMLLKMFPQGDAKVPEIRFAGFTDPWEQRKLVEIASIKTGPFGTQLSAKEYTNTGIPVINVKNIGTGSVIETELDHVSEDTARRLHEHRISVNDILFGRKGAIGRHAIIKKTEDGWLQGSDCIRVRFNPEIYALFINAALQTDTILDYLSSNAYGSTMLTLTTEMIASIPVSMPRKEEQIEIAHALDKVDTLITLHQRKLEKLKNLKSAMLSKMFV